jgi:high affinity Mn2+ porin
VGAAGVVNEISKDAQQYFAAGGLGILVGDGRLSYARERIVEVYYSARFDPVTLTLDYQYVRNPAYNHDRGPVSIFGFRFHAEF